MLADAVIAPAWLVFTEIASSYGKLTVISHAWGERGWVGDNLFVEPSPERAMPSVLAWAERRVLQKKRISHILAAILHESRTFQREEAVHVA